MLRAAMCHKMSGSPQKPGKGKIGIGPLLHARRARLSSKLASSFKTSSTDVTASLTKSIVASEAASCTEGNDLHRSVAREISASMAARIVADEYFADATASSPPSPEDTLALEVGQNAQEYLEHCFHTEVSVLDREAFHSMPQFSKSDLAILAHLGKGDFSDVFEAVHKDGGLLVTETSGGVPGRRSARGRRPALSSSIAAATLARPRQVDKPRLVFELKCLRPQIRSDADKFTVGDQDLVHETAILANLNHRHIIKLHGRASGDLADAFVLNGGYFILLDKLKNTTLQDRIDTWRPGRSLQGPTAKKMQMAHSVADALCYLHSKNILFRDLKPSNIGFDSTNVLKLFDFGFAVGLPERNEDNPSGYLFDKCGTPRYMAPEVGLSLGYALPADVYSFGVLLWTICASSSPFSSFRSSEEFEARVFMGGERPAIKSHWPTAIKELISSCWSASPSRRPAMEDVRSTLSVVMADGDGEAGALMKAARSRVSHGLSCGW